jgi:tRNA(Ile2) C34 agmatinyltransferase TiaS
MELTFRQGSGPTCPGCMRDMQALGSGLYRCESCKLIERGEKR